MIGQLANELILTTTFYLSCAGLSIVALAVLALGKSRCDVILKMIHFKRVCLYQTSVVVPYW